MSGGLSARTDNNTRQEALQGHCFYMGLYEPLEDTERRIRETADYIDDAEQLAG